MLPTGAGTGTAAHAVHALRGFVIASVSCAASSLAAPVAAAAESAPITIAVFDFELEDFSAGAPSTDGSTADSAHLARVTSEVRRRLAESGRYRLVDTAESDSAAVKGRTLRDCGGCEAAIALKLGAEQSLVGVVSRISRTEYAVKFRIRDARTGTVLSEEVSELRMGADYSWSRGAVRLIEDRILGSSGGSVRRGDE